MGGNASKEEIKSFDYECADYFVAKYVDHSSECKNEITRITGNVASSFSFLLDGHCAKITFQLKNLDPNGSTNIDTIQQQCKEQLDSYFSGFISIKKDLSRCKNHPNYCFLKDNKLECTACWDEYHQVRITGKQKDVQKAIEIINNLQKSDQEMMTECKPKLLSTITSGCDTSVPHASNVLENKNSSADLVLDSNLSNASSTRKTTPADTTTYSGLDTPVLRFRDYILPAKDNAIARFIRIRPYHLTKLNDVFNGIACVDIVDKKQDNQVEFYFSGMVLLSGEEFNSVCESMLAEFLSDYKKMTRTYTRVSINTELQNHNFLFRKPAFDNDLYYRWLLDECKLFVSGSKEEVYKKLKECDSILQVIDRELYRYEISFKSSEVETSIGYFIKNKPKYRNLLQSNYHDGKVYVTEFAPGEIGFQFKSKNVIYDEDIDCFKDRCKEFLDNFFKQFDSKVLYSRCIWKISKQNDRVFSDSDDLLLKILGSSKLKITGKIDLVDEKFKEISELIRIATKSKSIYIKKCKDMPLAQFIQRSYFPQFKSEVSTFASVTIDLNKNFHFESLEELDCNERHEFRAECEKSFQNFTSKFSVMLIDTNSRCIIDKLRKNNIQLLTKTSDFDIVTVGKTINITGVFTEIAKRGILIQNAIMKIETSSNDITTPSQSAKKGLLGDYPSSKALPSGSHDLPRDADADLGNTLSPQREKLNESENMKHGNEALKIFKEIDQPKSSNNNKNRRRPETTNAKSIEPLQHRYKPKKVYKEKCKLVKSNIALCNEMKFFCNGICNIEVTDNENQPFLLTPPSHGKIVKGEFAVQSIAKIEQFFSCIIKNFLVIEPKIIEFLQKLNPNWPENLFSEEKAVILSLYNTNSQSGVLLHGLNQTVTEVYQFLEGQFVVKVSEKAYSLKERRVFITCKVVENLNSKYEGVASVDCSLQSGFVLFKGANCFISMVQEDLKLFKFVCKKPLLLNKFKSKLVEKIVSENCSTHFEDWSFEKLTENNVEGTIDLSYDGKLELLASDENMLELAAEFLENSIHEESVDLPVNLPNDIWENNAWQDLIKFDQENKFVICKEEAIVHVVTLNLTTLTTKLQKIQDLFLHFVDKTTEVKILESQLKYFEKYHEKEANINMVVENGKVFFKGNQLEIEKAVDLIKNLSTNVFPFQATLLSKHFETDNWLYFKESLENNYRCAISHKTNECSTEDTVPHTLEKTSGQTIYGNIFVEVINGDISTNNSDVIVNGVMSDFDLSRGAISSSILRKAGQQLQSDCNSNLKCLVNKPYCRVTKATNSLPCKLVLHLVTPRNIEQYVSRIKEALDVAELLGAKSIAFPTLGAGGMGLDCKDVAASMSQAFEMFADENPTNIKNMKVVIYEKAALDVFADTIVVCPEMLVLGEKLSKFYKARVDNVLMPELVNITLVGDENTMEKVKEKIYSHISGYLKMKKEIKDEVITHCGDNEKIDVYKKAIEYGVLVEFQQSLNVIFLSGLTSRVVEISDAIKEILSELREALIVSKMVKWGWVISLSPFGSLHQFPIRASAQMEKEYEKNRHGKCTVKLYGEDLEINFKEMSFDFDDICGTIKRTDTNTSTTGDVPSSWSKMLGAWRKVNLDLSSSEYLQVLNLFKKSSPRYITVIAIERIQNLVLYNHYQIKKRDVEQNMTREKLSERQLFHGTSHSDVEKICAGGFDRGFAGKNATRYGKGVYFAVDSSYSIAYCEANHQSEKFMFLANVLTGDFCLGCSSYIVPPIKNAGVLQEGRLYDSVVNDQSNPTIFVVFKDTSVYPSYLITFK